jgi:hypothetical protein
VIAGVIIGQDLEIKMVMVSLSLVGGLGELIDGYMSNLLDS